MDTQQPSQPPPPSPRRSRPNYREDQAVRASLTFVEQVYHQITGQAPTVVEHRAQLPLIHIEQPYGPRLLVVGPTWQLLELGWVQSPGLLVVENRGGPKLFVNPTVEQKAQRAALVLEICVRPVHLPKQVATVPTPRKKGPPLTQWDPPQEEEPEPVLETVIETHTPVDFHLPPGMMMRGWPQSAAQWLVRCPSGETQVVLHLFPR